MVLRPQQLCGLLINDCGVPDNPFDGDWSIALPPKPELLHVAGGSGGGGNERRRDAAAASTTQRPTPPAPTEDRPIFKVVQLSDLHFDFAYQNGSEALCDEPLCCQRAAKVGLPKLQAGYWGTLAACDVPMRTIESLLAHISREHMVSKRAS